MIKLLGSLDILTGIFLILLNFGLFNWVVVVLLIYLLIKSLSFFGDILSIIDLAIIIMVSIFIFMGNLSFILVIGGIYLISKGFYSLT